jgi:hypothetical protein
MVESKRVQYCQRRVVNGVKPCKFKKWSCVFLLVNERDVRCTGRSTELPLEIVVPVPGTGYHMYHVPRKTHIKLSKLQKCDSLHTTHTVYGNVPYPPAISALPPCLVVPA